MHRFDSDRRLHPPVAVSLRTLCDIPRRLERESRKPDLLLFKEAGVWRPIPALEFCDRIVDLAFGLHVRGVRPGDRVAILSENRPEWTTSDYAILRLGAVTVPIYPTLLPEQIEYILRDAGASAVLVSTAGQWEKIRAIRGRLPALRLVAAFDPPEPPPADLDSWRRLIGDGSAARAAEPRGADRLDRAAPGDLASLIYTSGTTGQPKGVMLTHANFAHNIASCCAAFPFQESDLCLSILPLSHVYERMVEYCYLHVGASVAYVESIETVADAMREVRPTIACGVPRLFEKMHRRVLDQGDGLPVAKRALFRWAVRVARACGARQGLAGPPGALLRLERRVADRLVYASVRARLGGRLRFFISGSAPLAPEVAELFFGMGIPIVEGYGLTECSPVIALNRPGRECVGAVGPPIDGMEVRIAEDGEILARGASVMSGYYNDEAATRESIRDGWLHTGDIGRFDAHGCLLITDRKKEVLKTSGGKMVAPQPIENLLRADRFIGQAVLIGERRHFLSALIVPNFDQIRSYAALKGIPGTDVAALLDHPRIQDLFARRVARVNERLARFEQVRAFRLLPRDFTIEAGEITPTLKPRRKAIEERYRGLIESMYAAASRTGS